MTEADLSLIERELAVRLPSDYRRVLTDYPFSYDGGTADSALYDNAQAVIEQNRAYRAGFAGLPKWPEHYFFVGDDGAASCYLIDLRREPSPVFIADHGAVDALVEEAPNLDGWVERMAEDFRRDGLDPRTGPPLPPHGARLVLVLLAVAGVSAGIGYTLFRVFWP